jgi:hypothetical protein
VLKKFRAMEVTLNHNLRQFFLLAPDSLRNRLFGHLFEPPFHGSFAMQGRGVDRDFHLDNCMQPDFLFVSATDVVSIEMKIASKSSKSSVDQVLKYALLGVAVELQQGKERRHSLILLGPGKFPALFRNRFETEAKLRDSLAGEDLAAFLKNKPKRFRGEQERLKRIVEHMRVQFLGYSGLAEFLQGEIPGEGDPSPGAEVYRKLIDGLLQEIRLRELQ